MEPSKQKRDGDGKFRDMAPLNAVEAEAINRGPGRQFKKGISGNPGGRPKALVELLTALRANEYPHVIGVVAKLRELALAGDTHAAKVYLDRVVGPVQVNVALSKLVEET